MSNGDVEQQVAKPTLTRQHLLIWSAADCATQTDYTGHAGLTPQMFLTWSRWDISRVFGI